MNGEHTSEHGYTRMYVLTLAKKVKEMRDAQKHYFSHNKHRRHLETAKALEKEVDTIMESIINPNIQQGLDF